jgi:hypothetical protein
MRIDIDMQEEILLCENVKSGACGALSSFLVLSAGHRTRFIPCKEWPGYLGTCIFPDLKHHSSGIMQRITGVCISPLALSMHEFEGVPLGVTFLWFPRKC